MSRRTAVIAVLVLAIGAAILHGVRRPSAETAGTPNRPPSPIRISSVSPGSTAGTWLEESDITLLLTALERLLQHDGVRENETVLTFKDAAALARFLARAGQSGLEVVARIDALNSVRVRYRDLQAVARAVRDHGGDLSDVSGNPLVTVPTVPTREDRAAQSHVPFGNQVLDFIGASGDRSSWGRGVTIAVLDTGVSRDRTFGTGRLATLDIGLGTAHGAREGDGHGTSVASLAAGAAGEAAGVAPAANILSIRVTDEHGLSDLFTLSQAIVTAVDAGAKVVNISLGGYATNNTLLSAIAYAETHGAVIVAAGGNDQAAQLTWPAADPRVVSVGAVDRAEQQVTFSNSGPQLRLTAPGYHVQTAWTNEQRVLVDGTSAAAPIVAGAIASVMSQFPGMTATEAAALISASASDAGAPGADADYGRGIVNVAWAMNARNPSYLDTAISSHYYDPATRQMNFVVQNRSGHSVSGVSLDISTGTRTARHAIGMLAPGETEIVRIPVDSKRSSVGQIHYSTTLNNPAGMTDRVPANNRKSSVLSLTPQP